MQGVRAQHPRLPVTEYYLSGYSLGALDAAFVSHLDETRRSFNFKRVLLLNPPVNLYTSITNLDKLVQTEVKGVNSSTTFYELVLNKLTRYFQQKGYIDLNDALLYDFQQSRQHLTNEQMAMVIGTSFRFSAADIAFTSDLVNRRGLITPPKYPITESSSLTPFSNGRYSATSIATLPNRSFPCGGPVPTVAACCNWLTRSACMPSRITCNRARKLP